MDRRERKVPGRSAGFGPPRFSVSSRDQRPGGGGRSRVGLGARIKVWASQQKEPAVLEGAHDTIAAMAYDRPSQLFFAGARNGEVLVWRLTDEPNSVVQPIRTDAPATEPVQSLAIVSGTRLIAAYAHAMFSWGFSSTGMDRPEGFRTAPPISGAAAIGDEHREFLAVGKGSDRSIQIWRVCRGTADWIIPPGGQEEMPRNSRRKRRSWRQRNPLVSGFNRKLSQQHTLRDAPRIGVRKVGWLAVPLWKTAGINNARRAGLIYGSRMAADSLS